MAIVFQRPKALLDVPTHYCPGCTHGIIHRLVAECIDELGIEGKTVGIAPVGCAVMAYNYFGCDMIEAPHGRAPAVATGVKRAKPEDVVFTYQGDGDLAAIGTAETVHSATRGENITVIFVNNAIYGMTGGQMSPTTLDGQVTATTLKGRDVTWQGYPLLVPEMMREMPGVKYLARESVATPKHIIHAKKSIQKAFECQVKGLGYSFVEVIVPCPTGLKKSVQDSYKWCSEEMLGYFKPQVFKSEME